MIKPLIFKCPICNETKVNEHECGPTVTRELKGINVRYYHTVYGTYYITKDHEKWWTCANCGYHLPVEDLSSLIRLYCLGN